MYSLCLDCGATNVRAMVVDEQGVIVGKASQPNATLPGEENPEFHVWDADRIFRQLSECAVKALEGLNAEQVTAVTITTFGVDGALVDDAGNLLTLQIAVPDRQQATEFAQRFQKHPEALYHAVLSVLLDESER